MKSSLLILAVLALCAISAPAAAQTSVGFADPADLNVLLQYRLPDWGYRMIDARFGMGGHGDNRDYPTPWPDREYTSASTEERLALSWYRESERGTWSIGGGESGRWFWTRTKADSVTQYASTLGGNADVTGTARRYIRGDCYLLGTIGFQTGYDERRDQSGSVRGLGVTRSFTGSIQSGAGYGRLRDVTPLLQAQRLSERLRALGRPPLSRDEILRVADVLARGGGYRRVFDRPDRQLWHDVLEPLVSRGEALSPYEVLYLRDTIVERLGSRYEGFLIDLSAEVKRFANDEAYHQDLTARGPTLNIHWSRNLSLDRQLSVVARADYTWRSNGAAIAARSEQGIGSLVAEHLWILADRVAWSTSITSQFVYGEIADVSDVYRRKTFSIGSDYDIYIEDRLSLQPGVRATWMREGDNSGNSLRDWSWSASFGLQYDLENALF